MAFNIQSYCYCRYPINIRDLKNIEYSYDGINIFLVKSHNCCFKCNNKTIVGNTGEIIYATGKVKLKIRDNAEVVGFNIFGIIANKYCEEFDGIYKIEQILAPSLTNHINQIVSNYKEFSEEYLSNVAFEVINILSKSDKKDIALSKLVSQAFFKIKQNYDNDYSIEKLAEELNVSKSHLVREFCKCTGTTPGKYLVMVRIEAVKQLLIESDLSLNEISKKTGFSGNNYLCKAFKKATGYTPIEYKMRMIKSQYLPNQMILEIKPEI